MNQKTRYANLYGDIGFDRKGLFELVGNEYLSSNVLYPGCSMHITPSFVFQHVVYVDKSQEAKEFFADDQAVQELISGNKIYKTSPYCRFLPCDYSSGNLAMEDRTLFQKLPGYKEYAMKVRYRLVPGIW